MAEDSEMGAALRALASKNKPSTCNDGGSAMRVRSNAAEGCGAAGRFSVAESRNLSFAVATQPVEVHATEVPLSLHLVPCNDRIVTQSLILAIPLNCSSSASDNGAITLQPKLRPRDGESLCATRQRLQSQAASHTTANCLTEEAPGLAPLPCRICAEPL